MSEGGHACLAGPFSLIDSRRLTGANLYWDRPCAIIEVAIAGPQNQLIDHWACAARRLLDATGHGGEQLCQRRYAGGASLLVSAPIDALYSMCELNELAWTLATRASDPGYINQGAIDPIHIEPMHVELVSLQAAFAAERRPRLLQLQQAAQSHRVPLLWDEGEVSVGYGAGMHAWPYEEIPAAEKVDWASIHPIPLALVTGTNGKSTTVRMIAAIMTAAGLRGGLTSTDFIRVGDRDIATGDYSGAGGARRLLRLPEVEMAVLEVARGGLLRRGLGVERADVALITNVAADHFGDYGINSVEDMLAVKFVVRRALGQDSPLVLNADDGGVVEQAKRILEQEPGRFWWFSMDANHDLIRNNLAQGEGACWLQDGYLCSNARPGKEYRAQGVPTRRIAAVLGIPSSHGGLLRHNIHNAMGAVLVSLALGLSDDAIRSGLAAFRGDESDNPGRGNWFEHRGICILVDFAHNEHGLLALADTVNALPVTMPVTLPATGAAKKVVLMMGQAGDRTDELIRAYTRAGCRMSPARLLAVQLPGYERGRKLHEAPALIRDEALASGIPAASIEMFDSPVAGARNALENARSGDVLVLLTLTQRSEVLHLVHEFIDG